MNICEKAAKASTMFEMNNSELKKQYILKNIMTVDLIMSHVPGYCGSFGTGYPFYALKNMMDGNLPIIEEQLRYNSLLLEEAKDYNEWICEECLKVNSSIMPDLKQICKPCPEIKNSLKPRKVINRLPDIDMWMICEDDKIEYAKEKLVKMFDSFNMHTSDIDPVETIHKVGRIAEDISRGIMPNEYLPLDIHIIEYSKFANLLDSVPLILMESFQQKRIPYLPIHPVSLRKVWQYDDTAYNFVMDYLLSLTPFNFKSTLDIKLMNSRKIISKNFSQDELIDILTMVLPDSVRRRFETIELKKCYKGRVKLWKK